MRAGPGGSGGRPQPGPRPIGRGLQGHTPVYTGRWDRAGLRRGGRERGFRPQPDSPACDSAGIRPLPDPGMALLESAGWAWCTEPRAKEPLCTSPGGGAGAQGRLGTLFQCPVPFGPAPQLCLLTHVAAAPTEPPPGCPGSRCPAAASTQCGAAPKAQAWRPERALCALLVTSGCLPSLQRWGDPGREPDGGRFPGRRGP